MGIRDKIKRLERAAEEETVLAVCRECGEERRLRCDPLLDVVALEWQLHQPDTDEDELLANEPEDVLWVWNHACDPLALRDKHTGESVFGPVWERGVRANRERSVETDAE
jgi:hypothetical protein